MKLAAVFAGAAVCFGPHFLDEKILAKIQLNPNAGDGKRFVDMSTKKPIADIREAFDKLSAAASKDELEAFYRENFNEPGHELEKEEIVLPPVPQFLEALQDKNLTAFGGAIHRMWGDLARRYDKTKVCPTCDTSLLPLNHTFVIPGGRFREFYYWDSFFVLEGLNLSNLRDLSRSMLRNFLDFVDNYGFIPNGARKYMLNRSQPPFLVTSMDRHYELYGDLAFLRDSIDLMDKEYTYWVTKHTYTFATNETLTRYKVTATSPRPESYLEDHEVARDQPDPLALYAELAAGAESGWDYSSRWIPDAKQILASKPTHLQFAMLRGLKTSHILPVDLNALMYLNERTLAKFHSILLEDLRHVHKCVPRKAFHAHQARVYAAAADARAKAMLKYMWSEENASFFDYNTQTDARLENFYPSNIWPFWADALTPEFRDNIANHVKAFDAFQTQRTQRLGPTPTSFIRSGLQWDDPNSWAPLEYISVKALMRSYARFNREEMRAQALDIATRFTQSAYCAWHATGGSLPGHPKSPGNEHREGYLFEKYDSAGIGKVGGGGEYSVQTGFGWTNGVVLHFIDLFKDDLKLPQDVSRCFHTIVVEQP